jgi:hypothetical protein
MSKQEMKDYIVLFLALGLMILLFIITLGDFWLSMETGRAANKDIINLLSMAITGIVGIVAGFISGKNAADEAKNKAKEVETQNKAVQDALNTPTPSK